MRVSLIVATEADVFDSKRQRPFAAIEAQTYPHDRLEFIFVDAWAKPFISAAVETFRIQNPALTIRLVHCEKTARAAGYNLAATLASGDLLILLADDFEPWPELVAAHVAYHTANPDPNAVGIGPGLFPDAIRQDDFARWLEDSGQLFGVSMRRTMAVWPRTFFYGGNTSIKKSKFDALGGFDERFLYHAWDDYEFGLRLVASGGYTQFVAAAVATHQHAVSLEERCAGMEEAGESAWTLQQLHPNLEPGWHAMLVSAQQDRRSEPGKDAPAHAWLAYYAGQLDAAFQRGYRSALENLSCER